jgi:hypothetical protein
MHKNVLQNFHKDEGGWPSRHGRPFPLPVVLARQVSVVAVPVPRHLHTHVSIISTRRVKQSGLPRRYAPRNNAAGIRSIRPYGMIALMMLLRKPFSPMFFSGDRRVSFIIAEINRQIFRDIGKINYFCRRLGYTGKPERRLF